MKLMSGILWLSCVIGLAACAALMSPVSPIPTPTAPPGPKSLPTFLEQVYPAPHTILIESESCDYIRRYWSARYGGDYPTDPNHCAENFAVCVSLKGSRVTVREDSGLQAEDFDKRSQFEVDGVTQPHLLLAEGLLLVGGNAVGPHFLCAPASFDIGWHEVTYSIERTSGDVMSYTWHYKVEE